MKMEVYPRHTSLPTINKKHVNFLGLIMIFEVVSFVIGVGHFY